MEFAIVLPVFLTLLFATIDYGYGFSQFLDVKQGAREGARMAAVDGETAGANTAASCTNLKAAIKAKMPDSVTASITVTVTDTPPSGTTPAVGDQITVTVTYPRSSLTGLTASLVGGNYTSTVYERAEQIPNWAASGSLTC